MFPQIFIETLLIIAPVGAIEIVYRVVKAVSNYVNLAKTYHESVENLIETQDVDWGNRYLAICKEQRVHYELGACIYCDDCQKKAAAKVIEDRTFQRQDLYYHELNDYENVNGRLIRKSVWLPRDPSGHAGKTMSAQTQTTVVKTFQHQELEPVNLSGPNFITGTLI